MKDPKDIFILVPIFSGGMNLLIIFNTGENILSINEKTFL